jgi:hypothetical protein
VKRMSVRSRLLTVIALSSALSVGVPPFLPVPSYASVSLRATCSGRADLTWKDVNNGAAQRFFLRNGTGTCYGFPSFITPGPSLPLNKAIWGFNVIFSGTSDVVTEKFVCGVSGAFFFMDMTLQVGTSVRGNPPVTPGQTSLQRWTFYPLNTTFPPSLTIRIGNPGSNFGDRGYGGLLSRVAGRCPPDGSPAATLQWTWTLPMTFY